MNIATATMTITIITTTTTTTTTFTTTSLRHNNPISQTASFTSCPKKRLSHQAC